MMLRAKSWVTRLRTVRYFLKKMLTNQILSAILTEYAA